MVGRRGRGGGRRAVAAASTTAAIPALITLDGTTVPPAGRPTGAQLGFQVAVQSGDAAGECGARAAGNVRAPRAQGAQISLGGGLGDGGRGGGGGGVGEGGGRQGVPGA